MFVIEKPLLIQFHVICVVRFVVCGVEGFLMRNGRIGVCIVTCGFTVKANFNWITSLSASYSVIELTTCF